VRYFGNLSNIDDRVRNISWQTLNLTQTLTLTLTLILTLILTLTLNPNLIHTYIYTAIYVRQVAEIVYVFCPFYSQLLTMSSASMLLNVLLLVAVSCAQVHTIVAFLIFG